MKRIVSLSILMMVLMAILSARSSLANNKDSCQEGTWKQQEDGKIFLCSAAKKGMPQDWQAFEGEAKIVPSGESCEFTVTSVYDSTIEPQRIFMTCGDQTIPYPEGQWNIRFNLGNQEYKFIAEAGVMVLCQ